MFSFGFTLFVLLAVGRGQFTTSTSTSTGSNPSGVCTGDFNLDGKQDMVVVSTGANTVAINYGNGAGGFTGVAPGTTIVVGASPKHCIVADFDKNGRPDIAITSTGANTASVIFNLVGSYPVITIFVGAASAPEGLATADFNGDGNLDLVIVNVGGQSLDLRIGNGAGLFMASGSTALGPNPHSVVVGDFNADGNMDAVVSNSGSNNVRVLFGNGAGLFPTGASLLVGTTPTTMSVGDLNVDNKPDIVVVNSATSTASKLIGTGNSATPFTVSTITTTGTSLSGVAIRDLNGDSKPDLTFTASGSGNIITMIGDGTGALFFAQSATTGSGPQRVALADFTGDGLPDAIVSNGGSSTVGYYANGLSASGPACPTTCSCKNGDCTTTGSLPTGVTLQTFSDTKLIVSGSLGAAITTFVNITSQAILKSPIVAVSTSATIGGVLRLRFSPGFTSSTPQISGSILFLQAPSVTGTYTTVEGTSTPNVLIESVTATYTATTVTLNYVARSFSSALHLSYLFMACLVAISF